MRSGRPGDLNEQIDRASLPCQAPTRRQALGAGAGAVLLGMNVGFGPGAGGEKALTEALVLRDPTSRIRQS
jgi:hypothetical protein